MIVPAFLFFMGVTFVAAGVQIRLGMLNAWFAIKRSPGYPMPASGLMLIPLGLGAMVTSILLAARALDILGRDVALYAMVSTVLPLALLGLVLLVWQPGWILPDWYRWLKENHADILTLLKDEAENMGARAWQARVRTHEELEQWVEEVRHECGP